ncbi:diguanylate cyclase domain-containing protein [Cupriavidus basilensis]
MRAICAVAEPYDAEFRLRTSGGGYLWVRSRGRLVRGADGRAMRMAGSLTDISEHKRYEAQLFAEKERAQVTLQAIGDAVITTDVWGRVELLNPAAEALTGWREEEARGHLLQQVCELCEEGRSGAVAQSGRAGAAAALAWHDSLADRTRRTLGGGKVLRGADPRPRGAGHRRGRGVARRQPGTRTCRPAGPRGQPRRADRTGQPVEFERRLTAAIAQVRDHGGTHALMYLDLDQFKVVNDTCGHAAGDELIRQIAAVMRGQLRKGDTLARLGGDEFGILLAQCAAPDGERLAETVRRAVAGFRFTHRQRTFAVGVSIGLVTLDGGTGGVAEALSAADAACYVAKENGRNRVQAYLPTTAWCRRATARWSGSAAYMRRSRPDGFASTRRKSSRCARTSVAGAISSCCCAW